MKKIIIVISLAIIIIGVILYIFLENITKNVVFNKNVEIGKDIYILIEEEELVDYQYIENIIKNETDNPLELAKDGVLTELRDYMYEKNYKINTGFYSINQSDDFDEVVEIFEFVPIIVDRYENVIFKQKISDDLPEYIFDLKVKMIGDSDSGCILQSLKVTDSSTNSDIQEIDIYDLTTFAGKENVTTWEKDNIEFIFEDVNFDGYLDIKIFDVMNGTFFEEWIFLLWNSELEIFENNEDLSGIPSVYFDQENKLVYGTDRFWAGGHEYLTYQYIEGNLTLIKSVYANNESIHKEELQEVCELAQIEIGEEGVMIIYEETKEWDKTLNEMVVTKAEYVFYNEKSLYSSEDKLGSFEVTSKVAELILQLKQDI